MPIKEVNLIQKWTNQKLFEQTSIHILTHKAGRDTKKSNLDSRKIELSINSN